MKDRLFENHLIRYVFAGILSYAIELSCLLVFYKLFGLSAELSTAIAFWIGLAASFILQKIFAFRDYQKTVKAISRQLGAYVILVGLNYLFTLAVVALFPSSSVIFSRTLALIMVTAWNYIIYKKFIFNPERNNSVLLSKERFLSFFSRHRSKLLLFILLSLPMLLFFYQYLFFRSRFPIGDFDYYAQAYEAFRISVLHYHQLPLWNPWMSGGMPLFANPQFGLFSLQSLLVLPFGAIYGLKLAYVVYALVGFWGMYFLGRRVLEASRVRSALVSYIWIFCGFFAGHNIMHYTFASFLLLPWLFYFIARRNQKWSWLWFGLTESVIILSSMHYAFLMTTLVMIIYFIFSRTRIQLSKTDLAVDWQISQADVLFVLKTFAVIAVLAGYRLVTTYYFVSHNEKGQVFLREPSNSLGVMFKSLFWPIYTFAQAPKTHWGWWEYSMYIGFGASLALLLCILSLIYFAVFRRQTIKIKVLGFVAGILAIALIGAILAVGDFGKLSPFNLLHSLPGFTQTRVPSRWLLFTMFAILIFLAAWPKNKKIINFLLAVSVIELFLAFGPTHASQFDEIYFPKTTFANTFVQHDSQRQQFYLTKKITHSLYYSTRQNIGQVHAADSLIDTVGILNTNHCGQNIDPGCSFVVTHNAVVTYWSPNKIKLKRTGVGPIELDMNVEKGWRINNTYPFAAITKLDPTLSFVLPQNANDYTLEYAPKLSPGWVGWRLHKL